MEIPLKVGDVLYGYCNGYFGRDSYLDKRVEAVGPDWIVAREWVGMVDAPPKFAWFAGHVTDEDV